MRTLRVADPLSALTPTRAELVATFERVLDSGTYILGEEVTLFEREWARYCDTDHAVGVSSGTDAIAVALRGLGVGAGDEVLVPAMTALPTWMAVAQVGAKPIGVDIDPIRNGMDPDLASAAISTRTRALIAVHLYGQPADIRALESVASDAGVPLIEDAAHAHGATVEGRRVGSLGTVAAFSFYPTKNLGALGDAGAVNTSDREIARRIRALREYGCPTRGSEAESTGFNARLDELQAALLRVGLTNLESHTLRRSSIAKSYLAGLAGIPDLELPQPIPGSEPAWHLFVVRHPFRDRLASRLTDAGISTAVHYAPPPPLHPAFADGTSARGGFPQAERHAATALTLPMHTGLDDDDAARVVNAVRNACRGS
jgi:dTDP-3-amino-3,4,6-trideoxy-alpha-D-glucose transaminase